MALSGLALPGASGSARPLRVTRGLERWALFGALVLGLPAWGACVVLFRVLSAPPADAEYAWLGQLVATFARTFAASSVGALIAVAFALARSCDAELRRPRVVVVMGAFAFAITLVLAFSGLFLSVWFTDTAVAGVSAIAAPALGVRWGLRVGYPSVLPGDAGALMAGPSRARSAQPRCSSM